MSRLNTHAHTPKHTGIWIWLRRHPRDPNLVTALSFTHTCTHTPSTRKHTCTQHAHTHAVCMHTDPHRHTGARTRTRLCGHSSVFAFLFPSLSLPLHHIIHVHMLHNYWCMSSLCMFSFLNMPERKRRKPQKTHTKHTHSDTRTKHMSTHAWKTHNRKLELACAHTNINTPTSRTFFVCIVLIYIFGKGVPEGKNWRDVSAPARTLTYTHTDTHTNKLSFSLSHTHSLSRTHTQVVCFADTEGLDTPHITQS